jgi:hypothetical protein
MDNKLIKAVSTQYPSLLPQQSAIIDARWIKNDDEVAVAIANTSNNILNVIDKQGRDRLIDLLAKWVYYLGLMKMSPEDLSLIGIYIVRSYGNVTLEEIDLAIEYSVAGKLDVDTNPFGNFSPYYVSNIIGAYLRYRNKIMMEVIQRRAEVIREEERRQAVTPASKCQSMKDVISQCYKEYEQTKEITDLFNVIYNFLRRTKRMIEVSKKGEVQNKPTVFVLSEGVTSKCMELANKKVAELAKQRGRTHIMSFLDGEDETTIKKYARNYCVCMYFEKTKLDVILEDIFESEFE